MTTWTLTHLSPRGPVYLAIADVLARDIGAGDLSPGARLPTHRDLARQLGINVMLTDGVAIDLTRVEGITDQSGFVEVEATILR